MNAEDAEEYTQALGQVVAGGWRQVALGERLGVPDALGLTTREWVQERLGGYARLSIPERKEAVAELVAEGLTQREVADVLGVGQATVHRDSFESGPERDQGEPEPADSFESEPEPTEPAADAEARTKSEPPDAWADAVATYPELASLPEADRADALAGVRQLGTFDERERARREETFRKWIGSRARATEHPADVLTVQAEKAANKVDRYASLAGAAAADLISRWDDWQPTADQTVFMADAVAAAAQSLAEVAARMQKHTLRRVK